MSKHRVQSTAVFLSVVLLAGLTLSATTQETHGASHDQDAAKSNKGANNARTPASASSQEAAEKITQFTAASSEQSGVAAAGDASVETKDAQTDAACLAGSATLEDLRAQRAKLSEREKELNAKEAELTALKAGIQEEFEKLEATRSDIAKLEEIGKKENEEKVAKIVETLETMSPKPRPFCFHS